MKKLKDISNNALLETQIKRKEEFAFKILQESISEKDLQNLIDVLSRIEKVVSPAAGKLKTLSGAVNSAKSDITKLLGAGEDQKGLMGLFSRVKNKVQLSSTIKKLLTFESAVFSGMKQLPKIVDSFKDLDVQLDSNKGVGEELFAQNKDDSYNRIIQLVKKSFLPPSGIFGAENKLPYVDDVSKVANELLLLTPKEMEDIAKRSSQIGKIPIAPQAIQAFVKASANDVSQLQSGTPNGEQGQTVGTSAGQDTALGQNASNQTTQTTSSGDVQNRTPPTNPTNDQEISTLLQKAGINAKSKNAQQAFKKFYDYLKANPPK